MEDFIEKVSTEFKLITNDFEGFENPVLWISAFAPVHERAIIVFMR